MKYTWIIWAVLAFVILMVLALPFFSIVAQDTCAKGMIHCLSDGTQLPFWPKIARGFQCFWQNMRCVFGQF